MTGFSGHIYGVALNDSSELERLQPEFALPPYGKPPEAPVIFMKPRVCLDGFASAQAAAGAWRASATLALLFSRDACAVAQEDVEAHVGATALAIDLSRAQPSYHRPAVAFRNQPGTLMLGDWVPPTYPDRIELSVDGQVVHDWSLARLARPIAPLIACLTRFLTLRAGDVLLVGLAGDAPAVQAGQRISAAAPGLPAAGGLIGRAMP
jgi:5-oxopent-3-ene-1,2,5-tricarboxylate decarboxylase/2-hydroxyhepta-2,4-diene-1,7-dioate isomerase